MGRPRREREAGVWFIQPSPPKEWFFVKHPKRSLLIYSAVFLALRAGAIAQAQVSGKTPPAQLATEVRLSCADTPLRKTLVNLGEANRVAVFVDRRVDPSREVTLAHDKAPVWVVLGALARQGGAECVFLGNLVYVAPAGRAKELAGVACLKRSEARRLPDAIRRRLLVEKTLSWDGLTTPKDLLKQWEAKTGVDTSPIQEALPHDLWVKGSFPKMAPADMLTAILFGFDLTFRVSEDGRRVLPEKLPSEETLRRRVPRSEIESALNPTAATPQRDSRPDRRSGTDPFARERFTLSIREKPVGAVLSHLAAQLHLEIDWGDLSPEEKTALEQSRRSFAVKKADLDTLLKTLFEGTEYTFSREGASVVISKLGR